jgi:DNA-directed RNA polymerase subunit RPC12/RpoP
VAGDAHARIAGAHAARVDRVGDRMPQSEAMRPRSLKAQKCPECHAPLPVPENDGDVRCEYCGTTIHVTHRKPAAALPPHTLYVPPAMPGAIRATIVIGTLLPAIIPLLLFGVPPLTKLVRGLIKPVPTQCGVNESLTISGARYVGDEPAVVASHNCKLVIEDSDLRGRNPIRAEGSNVEITVRNSTIVGSDVAVALSMSAKLTLSEGSVAQSDRIAIEADGSAEVTIDKSRVEAHDAAILGRNNVKIRATDAEIVGHTAAIEVGVNALVELRRTTARASTEGVLVLADTNLALTVEGGALSSGDAVVRAKLNPKLRFSKNARVEAGASAILGGTNLELVVDDAVIEARDAAVEGGVNAKIRLTKGAKLSGQRAGIVAGTNLELTASGATIASAGTAVRGEGNARITMRDATVRGGAASFSFDRRPTVLTLTSTKVEGAQIWEAASARSAAPRR